MQVYNGKSFETLDLGNKTSWSTKIKTSDKGGNQRRKICASPERQKGAELPINPGSVYKNAGGDANRKTYGFKVIAYNKDGEAIASPEASPALPDIAKPKT